MNRRILWGKGVEVRGFLRFLAMKRHTIVNLPFDSLKALFEMVLLNLVVFIVRMEREYGQK